MMRRIHDLAATLRPNALPFLATAGMLYGLKAFYSRAGADDLGWILAPVAFLVGRLTGLDFQPEAGAGYLARDGMVLIAPACAGVNFLIIAFGMAAASGIIRFRRAAGKWGWMAVSVASAFTLAVGVNALRILMSIRLYNADIYGGWLTPDRVHRAGGAALYFLCLWGFYRVMSVVLDRMAPTETRRKSSARPLVPVCWYLAVALGVPLLNAAYRGNGARFVEHAVVVAGVCLAGPELIRIARLTFQAFFHKPFPSAPESARVQVKTVQQRG